MKWFIALAAVVQGSAVWAEDSPCVKEYRRIYIEFARTNNPSYAEAADIYAMYFDYANRLNTTPEAEYVFKKMNEGAICSFFGYTLSKRQIENQMFRDMDMQKEKQK